MSHRGSVVEAGGLCHTCCMTSRINARLDSELARKLEELRRLTGLSTTAVLRSSIEAHHRALKARQPPAVLLEGLVGTGDADPELSATYKSALLVELGDTE